MKDAGGVRRGVITGRTDTVFGSVGNDVIEQIIAAYPDRFTGIAYIGPNNLKAAIDEIERAMAAGFKGVVMEPGLAQPPAHLDDGRLYPVYAHSSSGTFRLFLWQVATPAPTRPIPRPNTSTASLGIFQTS